MDKAFRTGWSVIKNETPCEDCGEPCDFGVCDECWEARQNTNQKGDEYGKLPPRLHGTPLHEEGVQQLYRGLSVNWNDGAVNHPDMSIALYNLYDHYDGETGERLDE